MRLNATRKVQGKRTRHLRHFGGRLSFAGETKNKFYVPPLEEYTTIAGAYGCGIVREVAVLEGRIAEAKRAIAECPAQKAAGMREVAVAAGVWYNRPVRKPLCHSRA